ncbi:MAG: hypothetical protein R2827_08650 [Bdellovibrionales bacterium]
MRRGYFVRQATKSDAKGAESGAASDGIMVGFVAGMQMDSMSVTKEGDPERNLAGNGFSAGVFADFPFGSWNLRATSGLQQLATEDKGDSTCLDVDLTPLFVVSTSNYFTADGAIRYMFSEGAFRPYAGGHIGLLIPVGNDVTAIDEDSVASTSFYGLTFKLDYHLSANSMIPFKLITESSQHLRMSTLPPSS